MQIVYTLSYWFLVCIILLNVIFGIIIDSFGELRQHRQMIKGKISNECFICGIDRFTFDTKGNGFDHHVEMEHPKWNYLYLFVMLREKEPTEYNGWEQHVAELIPPRRTPPMASFLPRNTALSLQEHQMREEAETRQQAERAERTAQLVEQMAASLEAMRLRQEETDKKLSKLVPEAVMAPASTPRRGLDASK
jgi:inositol 1,4,5-triphosphate receptor type 1